MSTCGNPRHKACLPGLAHVLPQVFFTYGVPDLAWARACGACVILTLLVIIVLLSLIALYTMGNVTSGSSSSSDSTS